MFENHVTGDKKLLLNTSKKIGFKRIFSNKEKT
jgi:hypothetical protein